MKVDLEYIKSTTGNDPETMKELGSIFLQQVEEMMAEMKESLAGSNYDNLSKVAHKAKHSAAVLGLEELSKDLKQMEIDALKRTNISEFSLRVEGFRLSFEAASMELKKLIPGI